MPYCLDNSNITRTSGIRPGAAHKRRSFPVLAALFTLAFLMSVPGCAVQDNAHIQTPDEQEVCSACPEVFIFHDVIWRDKIDVRALESMEQEPEKSTHFYSEEDVRMVAKVLYRECRGIPSDTEKACVAWTICNRVDMDGFPGTIREVITYPNAFAYSDDTPVTDELYALASDVLSRWNAEKNGAQDTGRVLPPDFTFFSGDGKHNYFRNAYKGSCSIWDYSMESPYES